MRAEVVLPDLQSRVVRLSAWFADVGDAVVEGDRLIEVLVDGATFDVPSPASGRLIAKQFFADDVVLAGQVLGTVESI